MSLLPDSGFLCVHMHDIRVTQLLKAVLGHVTISGSAEHTGSATAYVTLATSLRLCFLLPPKPALVSG